MKARIFLKAVLITGCFSISLQQAFAQQQPSEADRAKMAAAVAEMVKPGPEHKRLEQLAGTWNQEVKFWLGGGKDPMVVKGTTRSTMILGGRFLLSEGKTTGPFPVETTTIFGFDRRQKKYTVVGFDTMGTYYVTAAGPYDEGKRAIVMYGEDKDDVLGHLQKYYMVLREMTPTRFIFEIIFKDDAHTQGKGEFKAVEITYTKAS